MRTLILGISFAHFSLLNVDFFKTIISEKLPLKMIYHVNCHLLQLTVSLTTDL